MKKMAFVFSLLLMLTSCKEFTQNTLLNNSHKTPKEHTFYNFHIDLQPEKQHLKADLELNYIVEQEVMDSLVFLLHKNLVIDKLEAKNIKGYHYDTSGPSPYIFAPEAGVLKIFPENSLKKGDILNISMTYQGHMDTITQWGINRIGKDWTELSLYAPWFPYQPEMKQLSYTIKANIPQGYEFFGNGISTYKDNHWLLHNDTPVWDIAIYAASAMNHQSNTDNGLQVDIHYPGLSDSLAFEITETGIWLLEHYRDWFSDINANYASVIIARREGGGGYARQAFIVLEPIADEDYINKRKSYLRYFAHEFSHLWWLKAEKDNWEDWLNESFAEYSAMMAIREYYGEEDYLKSLNKRREGMEKLPPIKGIDRRDKDAYGVLYNKGCVLLSELEAKMGKENFLSLLKDLNINHVSTTKDFMQSLEKVAGKDVASWFDNKLNT